MKAITLENLGYTAELAQYRTDHQLDTFSVGRVISEHRERYAVQSPEGEFEAEIMGNLRFSAESRNDLPVVGDWVAISPYDENKALIHAVYPRYSVLDRQAIGKSGERQIIATNIDFGLIMQAVNRDFSLNRMERYLTICNAARVAPILILSKIDLITETELEDLLQQIRTRIPTVPLIPLSNPSRIGLEAVASMIQKGKTYCLLGSSGVGKSTLLNLLMGTERMTTAEISESIDRGKHTTTHRELIVLESGGILIDNPGMREVGIADTGVGLEQTFETIVELAQQCKFTDCTHTNETGCAVLVAIEAGEISLDAYHNFQKLQREKEHYESSVAEKRKKDKAFGKMIKGIKKSRKENKF